MKQRELINKTIEPELDTETKDLKIQWDGRQFFIKLPTEFSELLQLKKGDKARLTMKIPETSSTRKAKVTMEVLDDE